MNSVLYLRKNLLQWYQKNKRDLPWRHTSDPYKIWISEIMLQQTQVATVIPYYLRWIKLFPDIKTLAKATESQVLKAWEGLGYYSRARNIHSSGKKLVNEHGGKFPIEFNNILSLKSNIILNRRQPYIVGREYLRLSGTSMAAPHVDSAALPTEGMEHGRERKARRRDGR